MMRLREPMCIRYPNCRTVQLMPCHAIFYATTAPGMAFILGKNEGDHHVLHELRASNPIRFAYNAVATPNPPRTFVYAWVLIGISGAARSTMAVSGLKRRQEICDMLSQAW